MDVKSAFLNRNLENKIFMKIPLRVETKNEHILLLYKALCGLKQVSKEYAGMSSMTLKVLD